MHAAIYLATICVPQPQMWAPLNSSVPLDNMPMGNSRILPARTLFPAGLWKDQNFPSDFLEKGVGDQHEVGRGIER